MEVQTWYYTLSTIAQTLAAVLAFAAVFLILRLECLGKNIEKYRDFAKEILTIKGKYNPGYGVPEDVNNPVAKILEGLQEFLDEYELYEMKEDLSDAQYEAATEIASLAAREGQDGGYMGLYFISNVREKLDSYFEQRIKVVEFVKQPGILAVITIISSITLLGATDHIPCEYRVCLLFLVVTLAAWSIVSTAKAAWKTLDAIKRL